MTSTFDLTQLDRFAGTFTSIRRPREFTRFSYDDTHTLKPLSAESLSYYYPPVFGAPGLEEHRPDLSVGFKTFRQRDDSVDEHLDGLLDTLQAYEEALLVKVEGGEHEVANVRLKADVVTWRGGDAQNRKSKLRSKGGGELMLTTLQILTVAFDDFSDFEMNATCFQVRHDPFIEENQAYKAAQRRSQNSQQPRRGEVSQEMMQYWGYKFESISTLPTPWAETTRADIEGRETLIVSNNPQYCSMVRTGIGATSLILAGEVDCVLGEKPERADQPIPWIELKTSAEPVNLSNHREAVKYERKLLRYWAQSFLLGVPKIMVGYRTPDGFLNRIVELETQRIPAQVKRGAHTWDGNLCINLTAAFLEFLTQTVVGNGVWRIRRWKNGGMIEVFKTEELAMEDILKQSFRTHREKLRGLEIAAALAK
ncbi:decapping endonuclease targeting mRNA [Friedmanniomyces endolithicus]|nr:decapping endonuclease targeting mRNA [Friedmanniomyces endolithicus]